MKRLLCAALAALILLSVIPVSVLAVETMTTSEDCIQILKDMEGFVKMPIYDNGQYTVGYGSSCNPKDYPNGITEKEADALLREFLATMEADINKFASRYNLKFSQNQFDALMLFTYNCGSNWVRSEGEFRSAVIEGKTGNDFIYAITLWSSASSKLHLGLVERRLIEADMYLNGSYTNKKPAAYTYVQFDNNGGVSDVRVQGYNSAETVQPKPVPSLTGARFLGWYTEKEGGSWVTYLTADTAKDTLYAHWQTGNGDASNGTPASYQRSTAQMTSENIYNAPGGTVTGKLAAGSTVSIVADYVDSSNVKWGKLSQGGWVNLGNPLVGTGSEPESVTVTVINDAINVRSGAGTNHPKVGTVFKGEKLVITETKLVGSDLWGKFDKGWISLMYTDYDLVSAGGNTENAVGGIVVDCDALRVRSGPGTSYPTVGTIPVGTRVSILQQKFAEGMYWGRVSNGWVSMFYVKLDSAQQPEQPQEPETPDEPDTPVTPPATDPEEVYGIVLTTGTLNIRSAPGSHNKAVGSYESGEKIRILEQQDYKGVTWGRTDKGWVSMTYVKIVPANMEEGIEGTVISNSPLKIRSDAGVHNPQVGTYIPGTRITVYEQKPVNGQLWGRTDKGWVCMIYVSLDGAVPPPPGIVPPENPGTEPEKPGTEPEIPAEGAYGIVTTASSPLNIRSGPGLAYGSVGAYPRGTKILILEQKVADKITWGRTDKGWVCMDYVKLEAGVTPPTTPEEPGTEPENPGTEPEKPGTDPETPAEGISGIVTTAGSPLNIRSGPGLAYGSVGAYPRGTEILILEQKVADKITWGRTDKGWVSMDYVKLSTGEPDPVDPPEEDVEPAPGTTGTVISFSPLNIRSGPGVYYTQVGTYPRGTKLEILEQKFIEGIGWGRTDKGWVCMQYVKLDNVGDKGIYTGVVTGNGVRIRTAAGSNHGIVGHYYAGDKVTILETAYINSVAWGRTDKGWICLLYVKI